MTDEPDNLILVYVRRLDSNVDGIADDVRDLKVRMTAVEEGFVGIHRGIDRLESSVERIGRRLDLVDLPH